MQVGQLSEAEVDVERLISLVEESRMLSDRNSDTRNDETFYDSAEGSVFGTDE